MVEIICANLEELKEKYPAVDISKIVSNKIRYYREHPFNQQEKSIWIDEIKDSVILINENWEEKKSNVQQMNKTKISKKEIKENFKIKNVTLKELHDKYKKYLYIEDTDRIDLVLAVAQSNKLKGIPLWVILVGASGDMKSVQLNSIRGEDVVVMHNLTSKTLVNGYKNKEEHPDLAPELDGKIIIIPDMAQILKLPPTEKGELWGQLRDLYDGFAGKFSGQGSTARYEDLKVTLLAGSTPSIDGQILVHQDLGTRELIYRTKGNKNKELVMQKCFENEEWEEKINQELKEITQQFLNSQNMIREKIDDNILKKIQQISIYITYMRCSAEFDNYTNELRNYCYPEEPTRIAKQLKRLYVCLKSLDENYSDEKALKILCDVAKSSAFPVRVKLYEFLKEKKGEYSTSQLSEFLKIGKSTAKRECSVLENIGLITCKRKETSYPDKFYEYWQINLKPSNNIIYTINNVDFKNLIKSNIVYSSYISLDGSKEKTKEEVEEPIEVIKIGNSDNSQINKIGGQNEEESSENSNR